MIHKVLAKLAFRERYINDVKFSITFSCRRIGLDINCMLLKNNINESWIMIVKISEVIRH